MKQNYENDGHRIGAGHDQEFDVLLTAYALGELEGEQLAAVEARIATDGAARRALQEMRATARALEREFAAEAAPALSREQRAAIERSSRPILRPRRWVTRGALAAGILAVGAFAAYQAVLRMQANVRPNIPGSREDDTVGWSRESAPGNSNQPPPGRQPRPTLSNGASVARDENSGSDLGEARGFEVHGGAAGTSQMLTFQEVNSINLQVLSDSATAMPALTLGFETRASTTLGFTGDSDQVPGHNAEGYDAIAENVFKLATQDPLSTFAIDVDTASYANLRRFLNQGQLPPTDAIRIEEMLNYFRYEYPRAERGGAPFSTSATVAACPWAPTHKLVQVGLRAQDIDVSKRPQSNLVFLVDVSGSMQDPSKLPLLVKSMRLLVEQLDGRDRVAIVVYAGASGLVLPSTSCDYKTVILNALESLQAGGSTNGAAGIELAYQIAAENKISDGQNRVILCTDGDFNVGITDQGSLVRLIEEKRASGIFLSVLGYGTGNTKDSTMEMLADKGNGNYAYIDTLGEARKVLVTEMGGTLFTVAKDVKIQVEFNPSQVQAWRLIGYENRQLAHQDFNDDKKDAGEIGAGHNVTALYEVVPVGVEFSVPGVDPLRYQTPPQTTGVSHSSELLNLKLRYKSPDGDTSQLLQTPIANTSRSWQEATPDFKFAAAVASFGMVLRKSPNVAAFTLKDVENLAVQGIGEDVGGYRKEFIELVRKAQSLQR